MIVAIIAALFLAFVAFIVAAMSPRASWACRLGLHLDRPVCRHGCCLVCSRCGVSRG